MQSTVLLIACFYFVEKRSWILAVTCWVLSAIAAITDAVRGFV